MENDSALAESFRKVFYDLRPGKQIERRIFLDAFHHLINHGCPLRDATYVGFGSVSFYDFAMFYRYLGFRRMISLENDNSIEDRVRFNKPYGNIEVEFTQAAEYIARINKDEQHVMWLDYDKAISEGLLSDVVNASAYLAVGSILIITVDAKASKSWARITEFRSYLRSEARDFLLDKHTDQVMIPKNLPSISRDVLSVAVSKGLKARPAISFLPLFSFLYDDSRPMYTFGGMIVDESLQRKVAEVTTEPYFRTDLDGDIFEIVVPRLTKKERMALDHSLPNGSCPFDDDFGITIAEKDAYARVYRYFPSYIESL